MKISCKIISCAIYFMLSGISLSAQQAHVNLDWAPHKNTQNLMPFGAGVISPEVTYDQMVTFRVRSPQRTALCTSVSSPWTSVKVFKNI